MRRFLDEEAELGSDNEENDGKVKSIDMNDVEEQEKEGDDESDLSGFVDREPLQGDAAEIAAGEDAAYEAFQKQIQEDDVRAKKMLFNAVLLGNNKKR